MHAGPVGTGELKLEPARSRIAEAKTPQSEPEPEPRDDGRDSRGPSGEKHTEPEPWSWSLSRSQSGAGMLRSGASAMAFVGGVACSTVPAYYMLHQDVWKSQQL